MHFDNDMVVFVNRHTAGVGFVHGIVPDGRGVAAGTTDLVGFGEVGTDKVKVKGQLVIGISLEIVGQSGHVGFDG